MVSKLTYSNSARTTARFAPVAKCTELGYNAVVSKYGYSRHNDDKGANDVT